MTTDVHEPNQSFLYYTSLQFPPFPKIKGSHGSMFHMVLRLTHLIHLHQVSGHKHPLTFPSGRTLTVKSLFSPAPLGACHDTTVPAANPP